MDASCKKSLCMTSYGGITRIRLQGRSWLLPLSLYIQAPPYLFIVFIIHQSMRECKKKMQRANSCPHKPLFAARSGFNDSVEGAAPLSPKARHRANVGETANSKTKARYCTHRAFLHPAAPILHPNAPNAKRKGYNKTIAGNCISIWVISHLITHVLIQSMGDYFCTYRLIKRQNIGL